MGRCSHQLRALRALRVLRGPPPLHPSPFPLPPPQVSGLQSLARSSHSSLFPLRSSPFALRPLHFALRPSPFALRPSPFPTPPPPPANTTQSPNAATSAHPAPPAPRHSKTARSSPSLPLLVLRPSLLPSASGLKPLASESTSERLTGQATPPRASLDCSVPFRPSSFGFRSSVRLTRLLCSLSLFVLRSSPFISGTYLFRGQGIVFRYQPEPAQSSAISR